MPALHTGAKIRYEEPVKFEVAVGLVSVTDEKKSHVALSEGDTYTSPKTGGVEVVCVESARINVIERGPDDPEVELPSKVDSLPKEDAEKVKTPIERPPATSDDPEAKPKAKKSETKASSKKKTKKDS